MHENARRCVLGKREPPQDVVRAMREWLRPHNCDLAGLLLRHGLVAPPGESGGGEERVPWLAAELASGAGAWTHAEGAGGGVCAGVVSVDQWYVA